MKKIMISLFILVSMLGFAEGENEGSAIREVPIIENQGAQTESTGAVSNVHPFLYLLISLTFLQPPLLSLYCIYYIFICKKSRMK